MKDILIRESRNAAVTSVMRIYYDQQHKAGVTTEAATNAIVDAFNNRFDFKAELRDNANDERLFVVNCIFEGRDRRYLTVWVDRSTGEINAHANHTLNWPDANRFQRELISVAVIASTV
ncbi:hypothetical protein [Pseudomonas phage vB_PaeM_PS119XW]|uniref:Uncharacterized protein n=1 Tax=Pseudomonas phage vB_PaeM_PS119XW TaxID=2601632 RepID=A0A5C1K978_9CAUD|nr:hypothetical protein PP933_gp332 [Pseudomonas phage vB_PaeM_PS119XW]QEM42061.1 hypothetical protein [Pseudomonas phage vB_PaeM_PS119XW]BEG72576.1 hypothetical protein RVBP21_2040 [Pseudomonas phage BRkr]